VSGCGGCSTSVVDEAYSEARPTDFLISQGIIPMEMTTAQSLEPMQDGAARFRKIIAELGIHID
jgi:hypothetical protein